MILGVTYMDVTKTENNIKTRQLLTERFTGTWAISYRVNKLFLDIDYTGNLYGPMLATTLRSKKGIIFTWSVQNIHHVQ
jgi:outer membrane receptor for ferrienterochelin and colicins